MDTQELLRSYHAPWKADFVARAQALPADLQAGVAVLLSGKSYDDKDIFSLLTQKTPDEFRALIPTLAQVFFPQFPETAAHTLEALLSRHSYPLGYERRAFRAPSHPLQVARAASWLHSVWNVVQDYPAQNLEWFAVHAGLLNSWQSHHLGLLLAQAIDDGNTAVFQVLKDTASTQHPVARMGRHVPLALLASQSEEAHALAEGLLLAAQRQEGLRQVILESVDEASLAAFIRLLDVLLREDLLRFAAALRAACVWFGLGYDVTDKKTVKQLLGQALDFLRDPDEARRAVHGVHKNGGNGVQVYLALYTLAMRDAQEAAKLAREALKSKNPEDRMAAVQFLSAAQLLDKADFPALLSDPDIRIGALAAGRVNRWQDETGIRFEDLAAYAERLPKEARQDPLLFPWLGHIPAQGSVLDNLLGTLEGRPLSLLAPYLGRMSSYGKISLLDKINEYREAQPSGGVGAAEREMVTELLQDRNSAVSQKAVEVMAFLTPTPAEVEIAHKLLGRKSADLRRGLIRLLAKDPAQGEKSALHLLSQSSTEQRQAGLQLLEEVGAKPPADFRPKNVSEETLLGKLTAPAAEQLTLDNGLGLFDPADLSQPKPLQARVHDYPKYVQRGAELLKSLDELVEAHRETPLIGMGYDGTETMLLMNVQPWMLSRRDEAVPMPLAEVWEDWWNTRPNPQEGDLTAMQWALNHFVNRTDTTESEFIDELGEDADIIQEVLGGTVLNGVNDLLSGLVSGIADGTLTDIPEPTNQAQADFLSARQALIEATLHRTLGPLVALRLLRPQLLYPIVDYLGNVHRSDTDIQLALDAYQTALSYLPADAKLIQHPEYVWPKEDPRDLLQPLRSAIGGKRLSDTQFAQFWKIEQYRSTGFPNLPRELPDTGLLLRAYDLGLASKADLTAQLIGPRPEGGYGNQFDDLQSYTRRKLPEDLPTLPEWLGEVDRVRDRVLDVELTRGDLETPATLPALALQSVTGLSLTLQLLSGMGKNPLRRGYGWNNTSKDVTFSHLLRVAFPLPADTAAELKKQAASFKISDTRLLDLAMFAPQWAGLISGAVGHRGLESGVYWLHAHTKDRQWSVPEEVREAWEGEISERTPLRAADLTDGAVDVAWFKAMYKALGKAHFAQLLGAAKYASSSGGHKRAELFASAILGEVSEAELLTRIRDKRNQDAVRSLGLLPLSKGKKGVSELEKRYRVLSDFRREARQFGSQRQASERLAADIGMQNLARSAGYADPQRLMWAMEARMSPEWQQVITVDGVTVSATMDDAGEATLNIVRGDKPLKNLPASIKKNPEIVALQAALKELGATRSRMRLALEEAMVRGDHFSPAELTDLAAHPVIAPMLRSLVWLLNEETLGLWDAGVLRGLDGEIPLSDEALRLAHPHDLFVSGRWREWQSYILNHHLSQPFKQVFREYYPLTAAEQGAKRSTRYQSHHVQPSKAAALLKSRGWVSVYEEGTRKTYHAEGINVWIDDTFGYGTPNEVEGMPLHAAYFVRVGEYEPLPLTEVPPRLFSETMRDLDLVVSVAHVGGVDPEASQSTVEMREALLRETLRLLKLKNVRLENQHALIDGHYSQYTVHLGSGTVHRQPGGYLCIVPVHNQHQGRLFLPFADPDPRTAEVVSKVLLLAEDKKIQDPLILEQLT